MLLSIMKSLYALCVFSLLDNSSVLRSYMRGETLPKNALSTMLACFLVYRSIPCLRNSRTQLDGMTSMRSHSADRIDLCVLSSKTQTIINTAICSFLRRASSHNPQVYLVTVD